MVPSENLLEEIKKNIFSLLLPEKNGMILRQLQREYLENFGQEIPFRKFGFVSLTNLFSDMKDKVYTRVVNGVTTVAAIPSAKSAHLSALVAGQKSSAKKPRRPMRRLYNPRPYYPPAPMQRIHIPIEVQGMLVDMVNQKPGYLTKTMALDCVQLSMPYVIVSMNDVNTLLQTMSHKIQLQNDRLYPCTPVRETSRQTQNAPVNGACSKADPVEVCAAGSESAVDVLNSDTDNDDFNFVPAGCDPSLMDKKKSLISKLASNLLNDATSKRCNELKDNRTENTIEEKRKEIDKSTVSPNQSRPQQWTDDINRLDKDVYVDSKTVSSLVNDRLKNKLEKLIEKYPDGIWCANLPEKFQEEYKVPLHYVELGFSSIREFASYLPEIFHCKAMDGFVDYMLYSAKLELPETTNNLTCKDARLPDSAVKQIDIPGAEREALPSVVSSEICRTLIPDTVLTIGESVPHLSVPNLTNLEEIYLEVVVVEIFTPSFFWIQLRSHQKLFKSFMDELGSFYTIADLTYNIPPVVLEEGLNCVCKYNDIWHRGIIEAVKPDLQVTVFFYDYGTLKTYPASELRYLHRSFAQLPAQAIPCGLVNTKPYGDAVKWPRTACRRFTMRVSQIPLIATIASTNKEDNSMMITLTDTSEEEDVHLNDWLVEQKLAEHGKMVSTKRRNIAFRYYTEFRKLSRGGLVSVTSSNTTSQATNSERFRSQRSFNDKMIKNTYPPIFKSLTIDKNSSSKNSSLHSDDNNNSVREVVIGEGKSDCEQSNSAKLTTHVNVEHVQLTDRNTVHQHRSISRNHCHHSGNFLNDHSLNELVLPKFYEKSFDDDEEPDMLYLGGANMSNNEIDWKKLVTGGVNSLPKATIKRFIQFNEAQGSYAKFKKREQSNVPTYSCFLRAIRNFMDANDSKKDFQWSPAGNIKYDEQDKVMSALKQIQKRKDYSSKNLIIAFPAEILNKLRDGGILSKNTSSNSPISEASKKNESIEINEERKESSAEIKVDTSKSVTVDQSVNQDEEDCKNEKLEDADLSDGKLDETVSKLNVETKTNATEGSLEDEEEYYEATPIEQKNESSSSFSLQNNSSETVSDPCRLSSQQVNIPRIAREEEINNAMLKKLRMLSGFEVRVDDSTETEAVLSSFKLTAESSPTESKLEDTEDVVIKEIHNMKDGVVEDTETDIDTSSSLFETSSEIGVLSRAEEPGEIQIDTLVKETITETVETLQSKPENKEVEEQTLALRSDIPVFDDNDLSEDDEEFDVEMRISDFFQV